MLAREVDVQFPLSFRFKILGLAPQIYVYDASGGEVAYVKQKLFKLREQIEVFTSSARSEKVADIQADRILDHSATYHFRRGGHDLGAVRRKGWRSIFKAEYHLLDTRGEHELTVTEDSALVKVFDSLVGEIPFIGFLLTMLINPSYSVRTHDGDVLFRIHKRPAFFEGKFDVERVRDVDDDLEERVLLGVMMMLLLERTRG